jgi:hypothetical protein
MVNNSLTTKRAPSQSGLCLADAGLTPQLIADPEVRLSVRSQITLLDEAAIALKDDCIGFMLARDHDLRQRSWC